MLFSKRKSKKILNDIKESNSTEEIGKVLIDNNLISATKDNKHNTFGETLDKLDSRGELPWGWEYANKDFINSHDGKLTYLSIQCSEVASIDDEIEKLSQFIDYYYSYKNECKHKGECFYKYFENMYMNCHNNKNPCFEFVAPKEERLSYIKENYDNIKYIEQQKNNLYENIINIIKSNAGILQSELIKQYDESIKENVKDVLYELKTSGVLIREKSGRSFKLYIKE